MNKTFQRINEEDVLFFDLELVRRNEHLITDSSEYDLYQWKTRDRETDEFLTDEELKEDYIKRGALKMCFNKIVSCGVGYIRDGVVYIKSIDGGEEDIIKEFCTIANNFTYVCGFNILGFDLPMLLNNGWRYFNMTEIIKDDFITSGKKPWNLDKTVDLMEQFKGTHFYNSGLAEVCYHFNIPTPKDDISGADVSRVYYEEGVDRISKYVKKDVKACIDIFRKMQGKEIYEGFVDRNGEKAPEFEGTLLQKIMSTGMFDDNVKKELSVLLKDADKKEFKIAKELVTAHYLTPKSRKAEKEAKIKEINEFFKLFK